MFHGCSSAGLCDAREHWLLETERDAHVAEGLLHGDRAVVPHLRFRESFLGFSIQSSELKICTYPECIATHLQISCVRMSLLRPLQMCVHSDDFLPSAPATSSSSDRGREGHMRSPLGGARQCD